MTTLLIWLGLSLGQFLYQGIKDHDWEEASKISFFQGVAIALVTIVGK